MAQLWLQLGETRWPLTQFREQFSQCSVEVQIKRLRGLERRGINSHCEGQKGLEGKPGVSKEEGVTKKGKWTNIYQATTVCKYFIVM